MEGMEGMNSKLGLALSISSFPSRLKNLFRLPPYLQGSGVSTLEQECESSQRISTLARVVG